MMETCDLDLELHIREEPQDGYITTLYGRAIPYGELSRGGVDGTHRREYFAPNAFDPNQVIGLPLMYRHKGDPIGVVTAAHNQDDGLYITAGILDTAEGRNADKLLRAKVLKGLSPGFLDKVKPAYDKAKNTIRRIAAEAFEISLTPYAAYATAGVSAFREMETVMPDTDTLETADVPVEDIQAREAIAALRSDLEAAVFAGGSDPVHPLAHFRSLKEFLTADLSEIEERTLNVSALSEQTGMVPPVWLTDVKGVLDRGRPCINAIGGPSDAGSSSLDLKWPVFAGDLSAIVATQSSESTEANSADIDITVGSATLATYASANRLTYQVIERAEPSYVQAFMRILMGAYGTETDYAFQTALWANDTIATGVDYDFSADTTGANFVAAVWAAMVDCERATGQPAEVVYAASSVFRKLGDPAWTGFHASNYATQNVAGVFDGRTLRASIFGVPIVPAFNFATDESQDAVVTNRAAIGWAEDGPRFAATEQAGNLSRDVAIYGYAVATPFIPAGIVSIYNAA